MNLFKNIYNYRELLKNNVKKEIRGRYKNSILGVLWTFLNPLLQLAVYAFIFPLILNTTQEYYVIFVCVGLIPWTFFTTSVSQSTGTIIANGNIIKKVYFPREILPISVVTSGMVNFVISTIIIVVFCLIYGLGITKYIVFYIKYEDELSVGDKVVAQSANKGVVKNVIPKDLTPFSEFRPNEQIHAMFASRSFNARMVTSVWISGAINKCLIELDRKCKDILGIEWEPIEKIVEE